MCQKCLMQIFIVKASRRDASRYAKCGCYTGCLPRSHGRRHHSDSSGGIARCTQAAACHKQIINF